MYRIIHKLIGLILILLVTACGSSGDDDPVTPANVAPTALAGVDQTVLEQSSVTLSGSGTDSDGTIASYSWAQTAGTTVTLSANNTQSVTFSAPDITEDETLTFQLTVTDDFGDVGTDSVDLIVIANNPPTADAGENQTVVEQSEVALSGTGSDTDGTIESYSWIQIAGTNVTLSANNIQSVTFNAPDVTEDETLTFQLTVTDNFGDVGTDSVDLIVIANNPPTADAGENQTVVEQSEVALSGTGSDTDGTIESYSWIQIAGTNVTLSANNTQNVIFNAPDITVDETLTFQLTVTDNMGDSASDSIDINVVLTSNEAPVVSAGEDQSVNSATEVTLAGTASDSDGTIASTNWTQTSGTDVTLSASDTLTATFSAPSVTNVEMLGFKLTVTDNEGAVSEDTVEITVNPVSQTNSIAIIGLGESILVTNSETVTVSGIAGSDIDINKVSYQNLTNDTGADATGTEEWSAEVLLAEGDNLLRFSLVTADNKVTSIDTTITFYQALDFTTQLSLDQELLFIGEQNVQVIALIGTNNVSNPQMSFVRLDETQQTPVIDSLKDDGVLPDEIQGDGIYTGAFTFSRTEAGNYCYRVNVVDDLQNSYSSEQSCLLLTEHYTNDELDDSVGVADQSATKYQELIDSGATNQEAAIEVKAQLDQDSRVGVAGATEDGGVWWVNNTGILGLYHPLLDGKKGYSGKRNKKTAVYAPTPVKSAPAGYDFYPASYLNDRSAHVPAYRNRGHKSSASASAALNVNLVQSTDAAIISPFINNPNVSANNNFGNTDDYFSVWQTITDSESCALFPEKEAINNGTVGVSLDDFKGWGTYGYIHMSTHGDNFFKGLQSVWNELWGGSLFLSGNLSLVGVYTGIVLPQDTDGNWILTGYEEDIQSKRLAISEGGFLVILPKFFTKYLDKLPNSLIAVSACRSGYNNSLINALLSKGAGAVVGFDDYVLSTYAQSTTNNIVDRMLNHGATFGEAISHTITALGASDGQGADLISAGNNELKLSSGQLANGDFESGTLTPWLKNGDGRIVQQLGATLPTGGSYMGIISTGLGFTTDSGQISQPACLASSAKTLKFNWNLFSEEFLEFCNSSFDDAFKVALCDSSEDDSCETVFETSINLLCENQDALSESDISFDRGGVYDTGWQNQEVNIESFSGKRQHLRFFSTDVGDSIYDTAILIDDITIE